MLLGGWGLGCGLAAPANTAIQASRAGRDAGFVLASSETMNNGVLLVVMPIIALWSDERAYGDITVLLGVTAAAALAICLLDLASMHKRTAPGAAPK